MDYNLKETPIYTAKEILDTVTQQPVDLDFTLPDYCADIEKILKCSMSVKIFTRSLSAGQLRVDGATVVRIIYTDSNRRGLRCCEQTQPFSASIPVNGEVGEHVIYTDAKPEYINCRALTPRRVTVHGAFSLHTKLISREKICLHNEALDEDLQTLKQDIAISELKLFSQDRFTVSEAVSFNSKSKLETIVRTALSANITDYSIAGERLTLKGELTLRMLYICDASTGEVDQLVSIIPFTETLRCVEDNFDVSYVNAQVQSFDVTLKSELVSEEPVILVEAVLCVDTLGYKTLETQYISDAFSTAYDTDIRFEDKVLISDVLPVAASASVKTDLPLGEKSVQKIIDIIWDTPAITARLSDSSLEFGGKVDVSILALTDDEELVLIERQVELSHSHICSKPYTHVDGSSGEVTSISYRLGDNNDIELRLDMRLKAFLTHRAGIRVVCEAHTVTDEPKTSKGAPLTLYYASQGEKVWDIAKRYSTSVSTLIDENSLTEDILSSPAMIMVFTT